MPRRLGLTLTVILRRRVVQRGRVIVLTVLDQVGASSVSRLRAVCTLSQCRGLEAQISGARPLNARSDHRVELIITAAPTNVRFQG